MAHKPSANIDQPEMQSCAPPRSGRAGCARHGARPGENVKIGGVSPSEDGGVAQHPIHDDDLEDLGPEDYEELTDEVAKTGIKSD